MPTNRQSSRKAKSSGFALFLAQAVKVFLLLGLIAGTLAVGYVGASIYFQSKDLPDITTVEKYEPIEAIQLFDRNDRLICTVEGDEDRRVVPLNQVSNHMIQAMLAAEDHHFFEHHGINFGSIIRAFFANVQAGHVVEGGSTITQQLVKNLFFTEAGRTMDRKIKEALMAYELERRYSKERILEMYLNQVYFGNNAYGIDRAASRYFDKSAAELNLSQAAFLAGLVKAPSELGVPANRAMALSRQREILDKMVEYGYVTAPQRDKALKTKLVFKKGNNPLQKYPYYVSHVLEILRSKFTQSEMRRQGLRVYTNLEPKAQEIAESVMAEGIKKAPKGVSQGALVSISVSTGAVCAMVGGVGNYWKNQFNRATNPHTVGSSFKPFVYLTAFVKGVASPETMVDDRPITIKQGWGLPDWSPKNFDHKFMGRIPMRKALALSRNVPSVRTAQLVGIDRVVETARLAGITSKLDPNLSLALGSSAVSPLDMASAYSTFARMGVALTPTVLRRIENSRGQVIEVFEPRVDKVFAVEPVAELVSVMQDVVKYGTGTQAKLADRPVAGKTGTADAAKDIWFIGFTPDLVTAVWAGNDENLPIPGTHVTGGVVMAKIWRQYNEAYYKAFPTPPGAFIAPTIKTPIRNPEKLAGNSNVLTADSISKDKGEPVTDTGSTTEDGLKEQTPTLAPDAQTPSVTLTPSTTETSSASSSSEKPEPVKSSEGTPAPAPEPSTRLVPTPAPSPSARLVPLHGATESPATDTTSPSAEPRPAPALAPAIPETKSMAPHRLYPAGEAATPAAQEGASASPGRRLYPAGYQSPLPPQETTVTR